MANSSLEARLDKLLERVSGGAHHAPVVAPDREVARVVKRTEVASVSQKQNVVKFIVIGVVIILLLVGMVYFVAKTKYGKGLRDMFGEYFPGSKKRKVGDVGGRTHAGVPKKTLVAEDVALRSRPRQPVHRPPRTGFAGRPAAPIVPTMVRVPAIKPKDSDEDLHPGAVPFRRRPTPQAPPNIPSSVEAPKVVEVTENVRPPVRMGIPETQRGPSPPIEDTGPPPPPELTDTASYENK